MDEEVDRGEARLRELGIDEDEEDDDHLTDDGREGDDHLTDDVEGDARPDGDVEGDARPDGDGDTPPGGEEEPGGPPDGVRHPQGPRTPRKRKRNATTAQAPLTAEALLADPGAREFDWAGAAGGWGELRVAAIRYTEIDAKYDEWIWLTWIRRRDDRWGTARIGNYPASLPWRMWSEAVATVEAEPERGAMLHCDGAASHLLAVWLHRRARAKPYPGRGLIRKLADQLTRDEGTVPGELGDLVPKNHPAVRDVLQGLKDWARESKAGIQLDAQAVWHEIRDEYRRKVGPRLRAAR